MTGVVREFQWNNPHTWIQVVVTDDRGGKTEWGFECGSPNMMQRTGWKRTTLKTGDRVVVVPDMAQLYGLFVAWAAMVAFGELPEDIEQAIVAGLEAHVDPAQAAMSKLEEILW